ncbi:hypothetical protein KDH_79750 [Dictyobacter sp. S3.2.2.5]|uniref:Uncharacterized protein n=1 Tax=Dictyobacter halimunensis TaxID=3026934 RepID=A0ABQ6G7U3_9CHLR|nr:hypothetical protein KDH_79750 [Dictyobacter sp. S3.2.2.5]
MHDLDQQREPEITITPGAEPDTYRLSASSSTVSLGISTQGLLDIANWVEHHRTQLRKDAGQDVIPYHVEFRTSRVTRADRKNPIYLIHAVSVQEAIGHALRQHGARTMKLVTVVDTVKEEIFCDVELQDEGSIAFVERHEKFLPQPPREGVIYPIKLAVSQETCHAAKHV